jgi:hypothetical protein
LGLVKEKSILGIHVKLLGYSFKVNYNSYHNKIYPAYYNTNKNFHLYGSFLGTSFNEIIDNKTEFVTSKIDTGRDLKKFNSSELYKKGNICGNGQAINDALLKNYTIIVPSAKDSVAIKSLTE